jgi:LmbE family N-acetylglucosaminyl deacetylase
MTAHKSSIFFISPHLDDVVFSCGGTLGFLAGQGQGPVRVINIFSNYGKTTEVRKEEEQQAARTLGFDYRFLDFPDLFVRERSGFFFHRMFRPLDPVMDAPRLDEIFLKLQETVSDSPGAKIYFPLGVGGHIDHEMCFQLGRRFARSHEVIFYEDMPYALIPGMLGQRLSQLMGAAVAAKEHSEMIDFSSNGVQAARYLLSRPPCRRFPARWVRPLLGIYYQSYFKGRKARMVATQPTVPGLLLAPQYVCIDGYLETKVEAMWAYRSQIGDFFYSQEEAKGAFSQFCQCAGQNDTKVFERFWKPV